MQPDSETFYLYSYWALWIWLNTPALSNHFYKAAADHYLWTSAYHATFSRTGKIKHSPQNLLRESRCAVLALHKYRNDLTFSKQLWPKKSSVPVSEVQKRQRSWGTGSRHHDNIQIKTWIEHLYFSAINLDCFLFVNAALQLNWTNSIKLTKAWLYYIAFLPWRHQ